MLTLPQAGQVVIQRGLGAGSPNYQLTNSADGSTTDAELATEAATGEVVAAWPSIAGNPKLYVQGASPSIGALQAVPGQSRNTEELAGRDVGPGVYGAYTTDGKHVRLFRYGGGTVAVGSAKTQAKDLGVATSLDGRIWVMWGDDSGGGVAVTRSNKAVTRFEPIQHLKLNSAVDLPHLGRRTPRAARPARRPDPEREPDSAAGRVLRPNARGALGDLLGQADQEQEARRDRPHAHGHREGCRRPGRGSERHGGQGRQDERKGVAQSSSSAAR